MLTTCVEPVPARLLGKRVQKQRALEWLSRFDEQLPYLVVGAGLRFRPGGAGGERLQSGTTVIVTSDAARMAGALIEKYGLDPIAEEGEIRGWRRLGQKREKENGRNHSVRR